MSDLLRSKLAYVRGVRDLHTLLDAVGGIEWLRFADESDHLPPLTAAWEPARLTAFEPTIKIAHQDVPHSDKQEWLAKVWSRSGIRDTGYLAVGEVEGNLPWSVVNFVSTDWLPAFWTLDYEIVVLSSDKLRLLGLGREEHYDFAYLGMFDSQQRLHISIGL